MLTKQCKKISENEEALSTKISVVGEPMITIEKKYVNRIRTIYESRDMFFKHTVKIVKTEKDAENKIIEQNVLPSVWSVHDKRHTNVYRSTHWATYLPEFEAAACENHWLEKE